MLLRAVKALADNRDFVSLACDYICHALLIFASCLLVQHFVDRSLWIALLAPTVVNIVYVGQYLDEKQWKQYFLVLDVSTQFFKSVATPWLSFFMAALVSYLSMTNLFITIMAMVISHICRDIVRVIFAATGARETFMLLTWFEDPRKAANIQFVFGCVSAGMKMSQAIKQGLELYEAKQRSRRQQLKANVRKHLEDIQQHKASALKLFNQFVENSVTLDPTLTEHLSKMPASPSLEEWREMERHLSELVQTCGEERPQMRAVAAELLRICRLCTDGSVLANCEALIMSLDEIDDWENSMLVS